MGLKKSLQAVKEGGGGLGFDPTIGAPDAVCGPPSPSVHLQGEQAVTCLWGQELPFSPFYRTKHMRATCLQSHQSEPGG